MSLSGEVVNWEWEEEWKKRENPIISGALAGMHLTQSVFVGVQNFQCSQENKTYINRKQQREKYM